MKHLKHTLLAALTMLAVSASAAGKAQANDYISFNAGQFNALRTNQDQAFQYGAEYRFSQVAYGVRPVIGAFGTDESAGYVYAGLNWDVAIIPNQLYIIPNFAVGAYREGNGKQLGGALEFRSGIELAYQFPNQMQVGIALNHLSNASLYDRNPGVETVLATYSIPVSTLRSWSGF
jgi:lipid A 3-O-deacylase